MIHLSSGGSLKLLIDSRSLNSIGKMKSVCNKRRLEVEIAPLLLLFFFSLDNTFFVDVQTEMPCLNRSQRLKAACADRLIIVEYCSLKLKHCSIQTNCSLANGNIFFFNPKPSFAVYA